MEHQIEHEEDSAPKRQKVPSIAERATAILKSVFYFDEFREPQLEVIQSIMEGKDTMVLLPTGRGKSLCYQIPAILAEGKVALIISPLISLMQDQVEALKDKGISSLFLSHTQTLLQQNQAILQLTDSECPYSMLYCSPERLKTEKFRDSLEYLVAGGRLSFVAIDEAHCISQWGHDFRPAYTQVQYIRETYPKIPILALTATATAEVKDDIIQQLKMKPDYEFFYGTFNRPNISYEVRITSKDHPQDQHILEAIEELKEPKRTCVIVYCFSIANCEQSAAYLNDRGYSARPYHSKLKKKPREDNLNDWLAGHYYIVCATVAFGMGIDKPDVRLIIHRTIPRTVENYYQESGRGGRDGLPCLSILLFNHGECTFVKSIVAKNENETARESQLKAFDKIAKYCDIKTCRRQYLLQYFGEPATPELCAGGCDICRKPKPIQRPIHLLPPPTGKTSQAFTDAISQAPKGNCARCGGPLVATGASRVNGKGHKDWADRTLHKVCWKAKKREEELSKIINL